MITVCFLFNHYLAHQVPHAAPYAFELSRMYDRFDCIIACSDQSVMEFAMQISSLYPGHRCRYMLLPVPWYYRMVDPVLSRWVFGRKKVVLRHNLEFFRGMDMIVAPERNFIQLKTRFGLDKPLLIHCRHGAGDRAAGFDKRLRLCDLVLLPGQKIVDRLNALGYLREGHYVVVGYPKFEVVQGLNRGERRFFDNDNPVVLYNPHFDQSVSSWGGMGLEVMEFFRRHQEYNLIFAPHVIMFRRRWRHRARLPRKYFNVPNIHVDLGSMASMDMTYALAADIYLGDVSSQVYEFLLEPRPCIFLNAHHVERRNDPFYYHWNLGQVVDSVPAGLEDALAHAHDRQKDYEERQKKAFEYTFYNEPDSTAAQRGARAIAEFCLGQSRLRAFKA